MSRLGQAASLARPALCIGPADSGLRAALASLEIPIVETWAARQSAGQRRAVANAIRPPGRPPLRRQLHA